jgi:hypothetical protein
MDNTSQCVVSAGSFAPIGDLVSKLLRNFAFRRLITADKLEGAERFGKSYYLVVLELILGGQVEDGQARVRNLPSKSARACQLDILSHLLFELWFEYGGL